MRIPCNGSWQVRVIPNKFAALSSEGQRIRSNDGLKHLVAGVGKHEVIIESPSHNIPSPHRTYHGHTEDIQGKTYRSLPQSIC